MKNLNNNSNQNDEKEAVLDIMSIFGRIYSATLEEGDLEEGDYKKDGLIYCGKCNTPRQMPFEYEGNIIPLNINCRCREEESERKKRNTEKQMRLQQIEKTRALCIDEAAYLNMRFEKDDGHNKPITELCKRYVDGFAEARDNNVGLLFSGDVGGGKTFYACCIANALIDRGYKVIVSHLSSLIDKMQQDFGNNRDNVLNRVRNCDLLVLDDFGAERSTDYAMERIFKIVNTRILTNKPMLITTNLTPEELAKPADLWQRRIYDRLKNCLIVPVRGESRRTAQALEAQKVLADILHK